MDVGRTTTFCMTTTRFMSHNLVVQSCMTKFLSVWTHLEKNTSTRHYKITKCETFAFVPQYRRKIVRFGCNFTTWKSSVNRHSKHDNFAPLFGCRLPCTYLEYKGFNLILLGEKPLLGGDSCLINLGDKPLLGDNYARIFLLCIYMQPAWHTMLVRC